MNYREPEMTHIGHSLESDLNQNDEVVGKFENIYAACVPLRYSLESFLEIPRNLNQILDYQKKLYEDDGYLIYNVLQGDLWKREYKQKAKEDEILLPVYLYYDDIECGNPLGSRAGGKIKFGAIYSQLACLPRHIASRLETIFFCQLIYSKDKKDF